jgi:hypothetical protein
VTLGQRAYELTYRVEQAAFELTNDAARTRSFELDLSALGDTGTPVAGTPHDGTPQEGRSRTVVLAPGESVRVPLPDTADTADTARAAGAEGPA